MLYIQGGGGGAWYIQEKYWPISVCAVRAGWYRSKVLVFRMSKDHSITWFSRLFDKMNSYWSIFRWCLAYHIAPWKWIILPFCQSCLNWYISWTLWRPSLFFRAFDLWPTRTKPSNGISTHDGEQLCKFILKFIQICKSYGPDKNLTFKCDLDLDECFKWHICTWWRTILSNDFEIHPQL